jgi:hypothetical protein
MLSWERLSHALCDVWNVFAVVRAANASRVRNALSHAMALRA